ncbi:hypothetical protein BHE74_00023532 [Ensete ventricosum]|nr:hypothetical protein BHE74_00023532 [Ensete ventricosum]
MFQDNASSLKAQLDQQKGVVDNLVSNTKVPFGEQDTGGQVKERHPKSPCTISKVLLFQHLKRWRKKVGCFEISDIQKGELPAGRTAVSSSSAFRDMDIEKELNELRRKANEY